MGSNPTLSAIITRSSNFSTPDLVATTLGKLLMESDWRNILTRNVVTLATLPAALKHPDMGSLGPR